MDNIILKKYHNNLFQIRRIDEECFAVFKVISKGVEYLDTFIDRSTAEMFCYKYNLGN